MQDPKCLKIVGKWCFLLPPELKKFFLIKQVAPSRWNPLLLLEPKMFYDVFLNKCPLPSYAEPKMFAVCELGGNAATCEIATGFPNQPTFSGQKEYFLGKKCFLSKKCF